MSASIVITQVTGRTVLPQILRRIAPSRLLHFRASPSASLPLIKKRLLSVSSGNNGDKLKQDSSRFEEQMNLKGFEGEEEGKDDEAEYEHSIRQRILNASLDHVLDCGWTKDALEAGARSEGLPPIAHGMFERGGAEIVHHFYRKCNSDLAKHLRDEVEKRNAEGGEKPKTRAFIQDAVETRLKMIIPYQDVWKEAMAMQALPQNAPEAWKNLMNLADDIWYFAGDRSTDFDWYTKRVSLAAVYKATEIYMLQDSSADYQDTWIFLDNRLNDLNTLGTAKRSLEPIKEGIMGLIEMARNIAGMNSRNR